MTTGAGSPAVAGQFSYQIGDNEDFEMTITLTDPVPTGRQVLSKSGRRPEKDFQLLFLTRDGDLEEIGLDETVDLRRVRAFCL